MNLFVLPALIELVLSLIMFAMTGFAFVDAIGQRADAYPAADKMTKKAWLIILGLGVVAQMLLWGRGPISIFHLAAIIATIVYLVDVRPAIRSLTRN